MTRSLPTPLTLALAWLLLTLSVTVAAPVTPARADGPTIKVEFTSLRLTGKGKKETAVLSGRVTNDSAQPAFGVRVVLWRSRDPIREPAAFTSVLSGANQPWGERLARIPDHYYRVTSSTDSLDPGVSHSFTIRSSLADLGFLTRGAVHLFGADVLGTADGSSNYQLIGRGRTLLVIPPPKPLPLTSVVLLSATPSKLRPGVFADDRLAEELTGRLDSLVKAAAAPGFSWLVDPALIDEVSDLADGYRVLDGDSTRQGTGQEVAAAWLTRFRALPTRHGARTLFANPDIAGAERARDTAVLQRSLSALTNTPDLAPLPLLVLPHQGLASAGTVGYVRGADADAVLTATAGYGPTVAKGPARSTLVRLGAPLTAAGPVDADGPVQRAQRQFAEALLGGGLVRLVTTATDLDLDGQAAPRWLRRVSLDDLLDREPGPLAAPVLPPEAATLPPSRFRQIDDVAEDVEVYADLVPSSRLTAEADAMLSRAASTTWIGDPGARSYLNRVAAAVDGSTIASMLRLSASPRVLMSSRRNEFPLSVFNGLTEPVRVRIRFESDNPQRMAIPESALITVAPGASETVNIRPEATSNGLVNVSATLVTEDGDPVARTTRFTVEVTDLGVIGWIIVIVSGVVLVAATALRIRQVRRKNREDQQ